MIEARERPHALEKESVMALSLRRANRVFAKAFDAETCSVPQLRKAHPCERHAGAWVLDHGARPTRRGWATLNLAIAGVLEACWEDFDGRKLTAQERHELRAIPSMVARRI